MSKRHTWGYHGTPAVETHREVYMTKDMRRLNGAERTVP